MEFSVPPQERSDTPASGNPLGGSFGPDILPGVTFTWPLTWHYSRDLNWVFPAAWGWHCYGISSCPLTLVLDAFYLSLYSAPPPCSVPGLQQGTPSLCLASGDTGGRWEEWERERGGSWVSSRIPPQKVRVKLPPPLFAWGGASPSLSAAG